MKEYEGTIEERYVRKVHFQANSLQDAENILRRKFNSGVVKVGKENLAERTMEINSRDGIETTGVFHLRN